MEENKYVSVSLSDLSKAFDSIKERIEEHLKNKLNDLGFSGSAIEKIHSFINKRQHKKVVKNTESNWISIQQGVPQGTILVHLIFNLYINELKNIYK